MASVDNLIEWVSTAREALNNKPRHLQVLLLRGATVSAYHAPADAYGYTDVRGDNFPETGGRGLSNFLLS